MSEKNCSCVGLLLVLALLARAPTAQAQMNQDYSDWPLRPWLQFGEWGLADTNWRVVVDPAYQGILSHTHGYYQVFVRNVFGWLGPKGNVAIPPAYYEATPFDSLGYSFVLSRKGYAWLDTAGRHYLQEADLPPGARLTGRGTNATAVLALLPDTTVADTTWNDPLDRDPWALYKLSCHPDLFGVQDTLDPHRPQDTLYRLLDLAGFACSPDTFTALRVWRQGLLAARNDTAWGFLNHAGHWALAPQYRQVATDFHEGLAAVTPPSLYGLYVFITPQGEQAFPGRFTRVKPFRNGYAPVRPGQQWGLVNAAGEKVIPYRYAAVGAVDDSGYVVVQNSAGRYGLWHVLDGQVLAPTYQFIGDFHDGRARAKAPEGWGYLNRQGKLVIPPKYADALDFHDGLACVKRFGEWGFVDPQGKEVIPPQYERHARFYNGFALIIEQKGYRFSSYYIDKTGQRVWPNR